MLYYKTGSQTNRYTYPHSKMDVLQNGEYYTNGKRKQECNKHGNFRRFSFLMPTQPSACTPKNRPCSLFSFFQYQSWSKVACKVLWKRHEPKTYGSATFRFQLSLHGFVQDIFSNECFLCQSTRWNVSWKK